MSGRRLFGENHLEHTFRALVWVADSGLIETVDKATVDSPYGARGVIGNVLEWMKGTSERRPGSVLLKGGAWSNGGTKPFTPECHSTDLPNSSYGGFGFRVWPALNHDLVNLLGRSLKL
jgi:hypothetical protein